MSDELKLIGKRAYPQEVHDMMKQFKESIRQSLTGPHLFEKSQMYSIGCTTAREIQEQFSQYLTGTQPLYDQLIENTNRIIQEWNRRRWNELRREARLRRRRRRRARGR